MLAAKDPIKTVLQSLAEKHGFLAVGVAKARKLSEEEDNLKQWLANDFHGSMAYMENHLEKRLDPTLLVPGAKSVLCFLYNYYPEKTQHPASPKVAKYAYGEDYLGADFCGQCTGYGKAMGSLIRAWLDWKKQFAP